MRAVRAIDHAQAAADAIQALGQVTARLEARDGYGWPADVDAVVSALTRTAQGCGQSLIQAARWLEAVEARGEVGHDQDGDVAEAVATTGVLLRYAAARAEVLAQDLTGVRELTAHLTGRPPESLRAALPRGAVRVARRSRSASVTAAVEGGAPS